MKILLVCAGGLSTSILMNKVKKWSEENDYPVHIEAVAKSAYERKAAEFDVVLLGPQISYSLEEVRSTSPIPVAVIEPLDYAMGNAKNVVELAKKTANKEG